MTVDERPDSSSRDRLRGFAFEQRDTEIARGR
jgi:hypothetical protein